jgi:hypothetical protein
MIQGATCVCILKEELIMGMDSPAPNQMVSPTQVWAHLSTDLQLQIVHLFAQLAAHFVLAQAEPVHQTRKETTDGLSSLTEQNPA